MSMKVKFVHPKPEERQAILQRQQQLKMARSVHADVRGNRVKFYEWLDRAQ